MGRKVVGEQERVSQTVGFILGAATAVAAFGTFKGLDQKPHGPIWVGYLFVAALVLAAAGVVPGIRALSIRLVTAGFLPFAVAAAIAVASHRSHATTLRIRAVGYVASVVLLFAFALIQSRRKREVDLLVFREASLFAFFATVVAAVVYGTLVKVVLVPEIPLGSVAVFGMVCWIAALFYFDRKYA